MENAQFKVGDHVKHKTNDDFELCIVDIVGEPNPTQFRSGAKLAMRKDGDLICTWLDTTGNNKVGYFSPYELVLADQS